MANYNAIKYNGFSKGSLVLIKTLTASSSANLSFVNGTSDVVLDSTYKEYMFIFNNIHLQTDGKRLTVNFRDGDTNYDATKTTTMFRSVHNEDGTDGELTYLTATDLAQSTAAQRIAQNLGNDNDQSASGFLHLFNPSSTTFVKHFISKINCSGNSDYPQTIYVSGYCNITVCKTGVQFATDSGNIDSGTIQLFGVS